MRFLSLAAALALCASLTAQSPLTTTFANNNQGSPGGAVYFDVTSTADLSITQFDLNCAQGSMPVDIHVYWRLGTSAGNETNPGVWFDGGTDQGGVISNPAGTPTTFVLNMPLCIPANATIGLAIQMNGSGNAYTTGSLGPFSNAELTATSGSATNTLWSGTVFQPRTVNANIHYAVGPCSAYAPPSIEAAVEAVPFSGTLLAGDQFFRDLDFLRWNFDDPFAASTGLFAVMGLNFGPVGPASTPAIPGLMLQWPGSNPPGPIFVLPPNTIGAGDFLMVVPGGVLSPGQTIQIQGAVLDPANAASPLGVVPSPNMIVFEHTDCVVKEGFESTPLGFGSYPVGWADGGGTRMWNCHSGGTTSSGTGPTAAASGSRYMYTETSSPSTTGDTYIMNTDVYAATSAPAGLLDFQLHRLGATIGTLEVRMGDGTGAFPTVLMTYTGANMSGGWELESLPFSATTPNVQFQFHYTYGGSFTGDLAVDDVCIR